MSIKFYTSPKNLYPPKKKKILATLLMGLTDSAKNLYYLAVSFIQYSTLPRRCVCHLQAVSCVSGFWELRRQILTGALPQGPVPLGSSAPDPRCLTYLQTLATLLVIHVI